MRKMPGEISPLDLAIEFGHKLVILLLRDPPERPRAPVLVSVGRDFASYQWIRPKSKGSDIEEYQVTIWRSTTGRELSTDFEIHDVCPSLMGACGFFAYQDVKVSERTTSCKFESLQTTMQYYCAVRARNPAGWGEYSKACLIQTIDGVPGPIDEPRAQVSMKAQNSIDVTWEYQKLESSPEILTFIIEYAIEADVHEDGPGGLNGCGDFSPWMVQETIRARKCASVDISDPTASAAVGTGQRIKTIAYTRTLFSMRPASIFKFRIKAENRAGWGSFGPASNTVLTDEAPALVESTPCTIALRWRHRKDACAYRVQMQLEKSGDWILAAESVHTNTLKLGVEIPATTHAWNAASFLKPPPKYLLPNTSCRFRVLKSRKFSLELRRGVLGEQLDAYQN